MVHKIVHQLTSLNDDVLLSYHNANYNYHVLTRGHTLNNNNNNNNKFIFYIAQFPISAQSASHKDKSIY